MIIQDLYDHIKGILRLRFPMMGVRAAGRGFKQYAVAGIVAMTFFSPSAGAVGWTDLSVAENQACAVRDDGTLWCFDRKSPISLRTGASLPEIVANQVGTAADWVAVTAGGGGGFTCGLKANRSLWCWGSNNLGQLDMDLGPVKSMPYPLQRGGRRDWTLVKAGLNHSCGLHADGSLDCWGDAYPAPSDMRFRTVGVGYQSTCAIRDDGTLWCWGATCRRQGISGPLTCWGDRPPARGRGARTKPGQIGLERDWVDVAVGSGYACGNRADGSLWCWGESGSGAFGKLGKGFWSQPTQIDGGPWSQVAVDHSGGNHTCGVRPDHSLWCWGKAGAGYIGGAPSIRGDAMEMAPHGQWAKVGVNRRRTCGIRLDGSLWCWGEGLGTQGVMVAVAPRAREQTPASPLPGADWRPSPKPKSPPRSDRRKIVTVDSTQGLLAALGSHRTIVLLPGEYSLPRPKPGKRSKVGPQPGATPAGAIRDLTDVAIVSAEPGAAVFTSPGGRSGAVLAFSRIKGLRLEGLRIESTTPKQGGIEISDCRDASIVNSIISGGWWGVDATRIDGLELERTTVRFVGGQFMMLNSSRGVVLRSSLFTASTMFNAGFHVASSDVLLDRSAILNNARMERRGKGYPIFALDEWTNYGSRYDNGLEDLQPSESRAVFHNPVMSRVELRDSQIKTSGDVLAAFHPRAAVARGTTADFELPRATPPDSTAGEAPTSPLWAVVVYYAPGGQTSCEPGEIDGRLPAPPQSISVPLTCLSQLERLRVTLVPWTAADSFALHQCEGSCKPGGKRAWRALKAVEPFTFALRPTKTPGAVRLRISTREKGAWKPLQEMRLFYYEPTD